jgi:predicted enzyme related to lactoylglutathione lyase
MANQKGSFIWYELMTTDADGAKAFYDAVVGWSIAGRSAEQPNGVDYRHIIRSDGQSNGGVLQLSAQMIAGGARPGWLGYLFVADVDASAAAIAGEGGQILMPPVSIDVGRFAMVTDPQGVPFYIMSPTPPPGMEGLKSDAYDRHVAQHVSWNELYTSDLEAAKAFYARHFDFEFNSSMPMGALGDYCFIDSGGQGIGAVMQKPPHAPVAGWTYYIRVASIDAAKAVVEARGGTVTNGPMEVPGGDWIINGIDPQGAAFALVGQKT